MLGWEYLRVRVSKEPHQMRFRSYVAHQTGLVEIYSVYEHGILVPEDGIFVFEGGILAKRVRQLWL